MRSTVAMLTILAMVLPLWATPFVPRDSIQTHIGVLQASVPQVDATFNHLAEFIQIAGFEQKLQFLDPEIEFGGLREEESWSGFRIVETDNTLEAIWVWSRYYQLTGDTTYNQNIANAWVYAYQYPAWCEGAPYYSDHVCAWGLAAERQYRETFNDSSHWSYGYLSAYHIVQNPLFFNDYLDVMVTGWACGNLYLYGEATGNQPYMDVACDRAAEVIAWIEMNPDFRLGLETWAMSSGTFVWGICNSIFRRDPVYGQQWLATYGSRVQIYEPGPTGWTNAWNVGYCNAQAAMFEVTGDSTYFQNHFWLTNYLLHRDKDNDGGIPVCGSQGSQVLDASWTTSYLAMMGCNYYLNQPVDAGVPVILSPQHRSVHPLNQPISLRAVVGNWSTSDLFGVQVVTSGIIAETLTVDLPAGSNLPVDIGNWTPVAPGVNTLQVSVSAPGDTNCFNDSERSCFMVQDDAGDLASAGADCRLTTSPDGRIEMTLPKAGRVDLALYNLLGQKIQNIHSAQLGAGKHTFQANLDRLPSGLYLAVLKSEHHSDVQKMLITH